MKNFKSGIKINQGYYKSFQPNFINKAWILDNMEIITLLSKADRMLGRLDMYSEHIPNIDLFISMHVMKEATQSSKIEGTQTNMEEALLAKEDVPLDKRNDWMEVHNYINAMNEAIKMLEELPFSSRLIRNVHKVLLSGVRGEHKQPGEFRKSQNWIGGASINDAIFVPPVHTSIPDLMNDIDEFVHNDKLLIPELLKIALIHYQFETIHPFLDGNGRTGRLMITLYLVSKGILKRPILYLSDYLEKHRNSYYTNLMRARTENDITSWFRFFLTGVIETADNGVKTFENILCLQKEYEEKIKSLGSRSANALKVVTELYKRPIASANWIAEIADISTASAYKLIRNLEEVGILSEVTGSKRGRIYILKKYVDIFNS
ncbi:MULTISPECIES: Fic family protein [Butyricimonas]|mgnify:FL=1|uniref:Fic family protein n=1 Tax=Butyricimonas TaxID=574697 RepID=UPI00035EDDFD|nr:MULTISPECIES: Fic family protein [Butyricimonas]